MNRIYLISLVGKAITNGKSLIGFTESKDEDNINKYLKKEYNITLGSIIPSKLVFQNGCHWEYNTNKEDVNVHIDGIYNIK